MAIAPIDPKATFKAVNRARLGLRKPRGVDVPWTPAMEREFATINRQSVNKARTKLRKDDHWLFRLLECTPREMEPVTE